MTAVAGVGILVMFVSMMVVILYEPYMVYCRNKLLEPAPWCANSPPNLYSYIQLKHWGVTFMGQWKPENHIFLLIGVPMLLLHFLLLLKAAANNLRGLCTLGWDTVGMDKQDRQCVKLENMKGFYRNTKIQPFVYFSLVMFIINTAFAHVQVSSRILSTSPVVYWFAVQHMEDLLKAKANKILEKNQRVIKFAGKREGQWKNFEFNKIFNIYGCGETWIFSYFILFNLLGITVYANFFQWT